MRMQRVSEAARIACNGLIDRCGSSEKGCGRPRTWCYLRTSIFFFDSRPWLTLILAVRFDVGLWIKANIIDAERAKAAAQSGGLKIAGEGGGAKHEDSIGIVLSVDKDEATRRAERDREAAAKRQQNILPAWHLKSTISGDLTALGIRENALRAQEVADEEAVAADKLPSTSSNDAILRGLSNGNGILGDGLNGDVKPDVSQVDETDCTYN